MEILFKIHFVGNFLLISLFGITTVQSQTVRASEFGFQADDATNAIVAAINSPNDTILIDRQDSDWIVRPLRFIGLTHKTIIFEPGVVLRQKPGAFTERLAMLFRLERCTDLEIIGYGARFVMDRLELEQLPIVSEWRNSLALYDCRNIRIRGLAIEQSGGDGLHISTRTRNGYCEGILAEDLSISGHFRQGMSIISLQKGVFRNCVFRDTRGTLPEAGVDLEPNYDTHRLSEIFFENCSFTGNGHQGILFALTKLNGSTTPIDVCFSDSFVSGNNRNLTKEANIGAEIRITMTKNPADPLIGNVSFHRTLIKNFREAAFYTRKTENAFSVLFEDLLLLDETPPSLVPPAALRVERYNYGRSDPAMGGIQFNRVTAHLTSDRPLMRLAGDRIHNWEIRNLTLDARLIETGRAHRIELATKKAEYLNMPGMGNLLRITNIPPNRPNLPEPIGREGGDLSPKYRSFRILNGAGELLPRMVWIHADYASETSRITVVHPLFLSEGMPVTETSLKISLPLGVRSGELVSARIFSSPPEYR